MRLSITFVLCFGIVVLWILSHFFLYTANWNESSFSIGLDSVSGSIRLKLGRAIEDASSGSYTETGRLESPLDSKIESTGDSENFAAPAMIRSPAWGTFMGKSDFLHPFEIESRFDTFKSFDLMVTIPYWFLSCAAIACLFIARFRPNRTEHACDGKPGRTLN